MGIKDKLNEALIELHKELQHIVGQGMLTDGDSVLNSIIINKKRIDMYADLMHVINTSDAGISIDGNILSKGSVVNKTNYGIMSELITQELFIPSSMVTPLPAKFPMLSSVVSFLLQAMLFVDLLNTIADVLDKQKG